MGPPPAALLDTLLAAASAAGCIGQPAGEGRARLLLLCSHSAEHPSPKVGVMMMDGTGFAR